MLGLSPQTILTRPPIVKADYTSDFTSDNNNWDPISVTGNLTQTFNQTVAGSAGWMKNVYDTNQPNTSGIIYTNLLPSSQEVGDFAILKFKIYLDGDWDGTDNVTQLSTQLIAGGSIETEIPQDKETEVYITSNITTAGFYNRHAQIRFAESGDLPQAGAIFWIKDVSCITYGVS